MRLLVAVLPLVFGFKSTSPTRLQQPWFQHIATSAKFAIDNVHTTRRAVSTEWIAPQPMQELLCFRPGWPLAASALDAGEAVICVSDVITTSEANHLERTAVATAQSQTASGSNSIRMRLATHFASDDIALCDDILGRMLSFVDAEYPRLVESSFGAGATLSELHAQDALEFSANEPAINVYHAGGGFVPHEDGCALTVLIPLSSPADGSFAGGGTGFWAPLARRSATDGLGGDDDESELKPSLVLKPARGSAMLFTGDVTHAGMPVEDGSRVVLVASFSRRQSSAAQAVEEIVSEGGHDKVIRRVFPDAQVQYLIQGAVSAERLLRVEWPDGTVEHFEGEGDDERLVKSVLTNGDVEFFEGSGDAVRVVRKVLASGEVLDFTC